MKKLPNPISSTDCYLEAIANPNEVRALPTPISNSDYYLKEIFLRLSSLKCYREGRCICDCDEKETWRIVVSDSEPREDKTIWFNTGERIEPSGNMKSETLDLSRAVNLRVGVEAPEDEKTFYLKVLNK